MQAFGLRVRDRREALGLTGDAVAAYIGMTQGNYSRWERDTIKPPKDQERLRKLGEVLEWSRDELLGLNGKGGDVRNGNRAIRIPLITAPERDLTRLLKELRMMDVERMLRQLAQFPTEQQRWLEQLIRFMAIEGNPKIQEHKDKRERDGEYNPSIEEDQGRYQK